MSLKPLDKSDPLLRKVCEEVSLDELKTQDFQEIINDMLDIVYGRSNKGENHNSNHPMTVGLSANQIGIMKRISIVDLAIGHNSYNDLHVLINPKIIWNSKEKFKHFEGCVNLPEVWGEVERYTEVHVEAIDRSGNIIILKLKDWPAVLLQHEIDHLNGYLYIDHLPDPKKAHFVEKDFTGEWKKSRETWDKFIDVSKLIRKK